MERTHPQSGPERAEQTEGGSVRQSAVSRGRAPKPVLFRLVVSPDGAPAVDLNAKAGGRGVYVAPEELAEALSEKGAARVFRGRAKGYGPDEVRRQVALTAERLEARILDLLGLCRRAGALEIGMDAVERALASRPERTMVVVASDFSERSRARIEAGVAARAPGSAAVAEAPTMERIGQALGRDPVGVAVTWHDRLSRSLALEDARLSALLGRRGRATSLELPQPRAARVDRASPRAARVAVRKETRKND